MSYTAKQRHTFGFTLIELSIVLVIIGLIVGGVLVGRELIRAAELRALVSQVDQLKVASNTFKGKYGALPGDMHPSKALQFGFFTFTGSLAGTSVDGNGFSPNYTEYLSMKMAFGNNNGVLESLPIEWFCANECGAFWSHLASAGLIASMGDVVLEPDTDLYDGYAGQRAGTPQGETPDIPLSFNLYMPATKGISGFVGAGSVASSYSMINTGIDITKNFFWVAPTAKAELYSLSEPILSALDSYSIDVKMDDGKPNSGMFLVSTLDPVQQQQYRWSNGTVDYLGNALTANSIVCAIGGANAFTGDVRYNTSAATGGNMKSCFPIFVW